LSAACWMARTIWTLPPAVDWVMPCWAAYSAATPDTCGAAIEVPLSVPYSVGSPELVGGLVGRVEKIPSPGAAMPTSLPADENDARPSLRVVAPTPSAKLHAAG